MSSDFIDYLAEALAPLGSVRSKRMFGGIGVYIDDLFCAIVADDCLYFKGDDLNEATFKAAGCPPFTYGKDGERCAMRYYRPPDDALDDSHELLRWARLALEAALRKAARPASKPNRAKAKASTSPGPTRLKP